MNTTPSGGTRLLTKKSTPLGLPWRFLLLTMLVCGGALATVCVTALTEHSHALVPIAVTTRSPADLRAISNPTPRPEPDVVEVPIVAYDFTQPVAKGETVDEDYFADAVFLGDSRTDGLRLYGGMKGPDFLAYKSLSIFQVTGTGGVAKASIPMNGRGATATVLDQLEDTEYGKVYIMLGINEMGFGDEEEFYETFGLLIDEVHQRQPNAVIYIQSIVPIRPEKAVRVNPAKWLNNENVARYNEILQQVAEEKLVAYIDVQEALVDEDGILPDEHTVDGIHFTKDWYKEWYAYLTTHTADWDSYDRGVRALSETERGAIP